MLYSVSFFLEVESETADKGTYTPDTSFYFGVAVGVNVVLALVLIVLVLVLVWLWRRRWTLPCAGKVCCRHVLVALTRCIMLSQLTY